MIKTKKGKTKFKGTIAEIVSDFTCIVDSYKELLIKGIGMSEEEVIEHINNRVDIGLMTKEGGQADE